MNKLKNKVFFTIFTILTVFVVSLIGIYNIGKYLENKKLILNNLDNATHIRRNDVDIDRDESGNNMPKMPDNTKNKVDAIKDDEFFDKDIKFMDATIYTILINDSNNIIDVINHSHNSLSNSEITSLARKILTNKNIEKKHIGCLYFDNYSYMYFKGNSLIILDNSEITHSLLLSLKISILVLILLEIAIYFISKMITNWITVPVKSSFDKQKQFIADASHELKTPISVIITSSEVLEDNPTEMKWLKNIQSEAARMNLLVTELLELSASENENKIGLELGNLSKTVELAVLTFEGITFENNLKLDYKIEENIKIKMNENSIKELIEILLDNAIKHSKEKGTINVTLKSKENNIELLVENEGKEIPKGEEEKIFERFYRVDKARNRKENRYGLGLAIAKNIVESHNGKISASSCDGKTTFKVLFKK